MGKLAIEGGCPVRNHPLPPDYPGATMMGEEEVEAVNKVIKAQSPFRFYGENVQHTVDQLEEMMAKDLEVPYVLGVSSCTAAIVIALKALGVGYGDKVIVPSVTFIATAGAVISANAVPVFVDVDASLNLDPNDLERVMDDEVKAIIAVPLSGNPNDMDSIMAFAKKHNIYVIEDVAQSCGIKYKGRHQGTIGDIGVFSFQMNKILTAGEGGAIATKDKNLFERIVRYHDQGSFRAGIKNKFDIESSDIQSSFAGQNYRMSEITGAILVEQWKKLDRIINATKKSRKYIMDAVAEKLPNIKFQKCIDDEGHVGIAFGIQFEKPNDAKLFHDALNSENVGCRFIYRRKPVYRFDQIFHQRTTEKDNFPFNYPFKKPVLYTENMCPNAEYYLQRTIQVPISPMFTDQDVHDVITGIVKVYDTLFSKTGEKTS
ncbi:DegT/DnrJ/EryC1/StrS aminotransferase family protein [Pontibacillus sp. HMF3514]|uniref:DegT/DnrJ/EryC1/StrS family aminotransferase n=1 Tax=Pontibacillus sp. HMF3514 TaxID=2692425 RepID=UPI00131F4E35|nr:DegT/DnrJ/EryC1/StrS family aminotransferase [Pontibacillus sp. HMF3514]QHE53031.1 aminotransferase class V-fold PLP-dependent enzyme [Pontibacillus sp. HMF3514]